MLEIKLYFEINQNKANYQAIIYKRNLKIIFCDQKLYNNLINFFKNS